MILRDPGFRSARAWAEISTPALRANARALIKHVGGTASLMPVVKSDAYGHGLEQVAQALEGIASIFAVANFEEGLRVRSVLPDVDILILGTSLPFERGEILAAGMIPTISSAAEARAFADVAGPRPFRVHCKLDTGMGRTGIWHSDSSEEVRAISEIPRLKIHSLSSHLAAADESPEFTRQQLDDFEQAIDQLKTLDHSAQIHILNSSGTLLHPLAAQDFIRVGLSLYGVAPIPTHQHLLTPALQWKTRVANIRTIPPGRTLSYGATFRTTRPTDVATLTLGYGDGYPRSASNQNAHVLIGGTRCPILGRVTMDQILVDVTQVATSGPGEEVVLIGRQGGATILASELATWAGTIPWEILTRIGGRTKRFYC